MPDKTTPTMSPNTPQPLPPPAGYPRATLATIGSARAVLQRIAANPNSLWWRGIADRLLSCNRSTELERIDVFIDPSLECTGRYDLDLTTGQSLTRVHPRAMCSDFNNVHQISHCLTAPVIAYSPIAESLVPIWEAAHYTADLAVHHGMQSIDEFVVEYISNPGFEQPLRFTRYGQRSFAEHIIDVLLSLVGRAREGGSLAGALRPVVDNILNSRLQRVTRGPTGQGPQVRGITSSQPGQGCPRPLSLQDDLIRTGLKDRITLDQAKSIRFPCEFYDASRPTWRYTDGPWHQALSDFQQGDELWHRCINLHGDYGACIRQGVAMLRRGAVISSLVLSKSLLDLKPM